MIKDIVQMTNIQHDDTLECKWEAFKKVILLCTNKCFLTEHIPYNGINYRKICLISRNRQRFSFGLIGLALSKPIKPKPVQESIWPNQLALIDLAQNCSVKLEPPQIELKLVKGLKRTKSLNHLKMV